MSTTSSVNSTSTDAATAAALLNRSGSASSSAASSSAVNATSAKEASDRFLKLLVTQLQNQDPMNPVDNAQMTSQMAQISTVSGIEKLNTSVQGLNGQFMQMQAMQGASLVGKSVLLKGDALSVSPGAAGSAGNVASGIFEIPAAVDHAKVEVLSPSGRVVDTMNLGAQTTGRHEFTWPGGTNISEKDGYRFRVTASSGATPVSATTLTRDTVNAVNTGGAQLTLELTRSGTVPYAQITALD